MGRACAALLRGQFKLEYLPLTDRTKEVINAVHEYRRQIWYKSCCEYRHEPFDDQQIWAAKARGLSLLIGLYKEDEFLADMDITSLRNAAERTLAWNLTVSDDGATSSRAAIEMERYGLHLEAMAMGVSREGTPRSWKEAFEYFGYTYIVHETPLNRLLDILKAGALRPRLDELEINMGPGSSSDYVYFGLPNKHFESVRPDFSTYVDPEEVGKELSPVSLRETAALFIVSTEAFDTFNWSHGNSFWEHGKWSERFSLPKNNRTLGFLNIRRQADPFDYDMRFPNSEWLFTEPILLDKIPFKIVVNPKVKSQVIQMLKDEKIPSWLIEKIE